LTKNEINDNRLVTIIDEQLA